MKYDFDEIIDRRGTNSIKWDNGDGLIKSGIALRFDEDTISAFVADMDFRTSRPIIDAVKRTAEMGMMGYTSIKDEEYYRAIIKWFGERYGMEIKRDEIVFTTGTVTAVEHCVNAFTRPGDGIIIMRPVYYPFTNVIHASNRYLVNVQLINNQGYYTIDFDELEKAASSRQNKMLILCSPHNPVGRVWTEEELKKIIDICERHDVMIVSDEIHGDLTRVGQRFYPISNYTSYSKLVTLTAINKTFNLAGLEVTNVIIRDEMLRNRYIATQGRVWPSPFAAPALIAAYNESGDWLEQLKEYLDGNIDRIIEFLREEMPKVKVFRPEATYIMWLDFREYGLSLEEIRERIYVKANVVLESGFIFDPDNGDGFERICVPTRRAVIEEILNRISNAFSDLK